MATTVIKSIGTSSRDYSTIQAWENALPSDLTTTRSNNCTGGTTSTIILDAGASAANEFYTGHTVVNITAEERLITAYNGTTKIATIGSLNGSSATWTTPLTGEAFTINAVIWQGQAYNDSEFVVGASVVTFSGSTTSATAYVELTAASGQSFQDAAGVRTNALKYNTANGVGLRCSANGDHVVSVGISYLRLTRLQIKNDATTTHRGINVSGGGRLSMIYRDLIISTVAGFCFYLDNGGLAVNVLSFKTGSTGEGGALLTSGSKAIGCTTIKTSDSAASQTGFVALYANNIIQSCASFGFSTCASSSQWDTTNSKNNAANNASGLPGSSNQHSITFSSTSPFTNSTVASQDSIPVTGTNLSANGFRDATNAPNDITATARTATPTIGCWELVSAVTVLMSMWNRPLGRPVDNPVKVVGY